MWKDQYKILEQTWTPQTRSQNATRGVPTLYDKVKIIKLDFQKGFETEVPCSSYLAMFHLLTTTHKKNDEKPKRGPVSTAVSHGNDCITALKPARSEEKRPGNRKVKIGLDGWLQKIYRKSTFDVKVPLKHLEDLRIKLQN